MFEMDFMMLNDENADSAQAENSEKIRELENDCDWSDDTNNLTNLWSNTIPIEVLYPNKSPDFNSEKSDGVVNDLNSTLYDQNRQQAVVSKVIEDNALNFDDFINYDLYNNLQFSSLPDNDFINNNKTVGNKTFDKNTVYISYTNSNFNNNTPKNTPNNMFSDNKNKNIDISEWLKEQNAKKGNTSMHASGDLEYFNFGDNKFNFLSSPATYSSCLSPSTPPAPSLSSNSSLYNSPLTCVLLSPSLYANSATQQGISKATTITSGTKRLDLENSNHQAKGTETYLSGVSEDSFDPSKRAFSAEELKISQIIPKSQKKFVPNDKKDTFYWSRRLKNNKAAKRSREAKRMKENQITLRTAFLEEENSRLKNEVTKLAGENKQLRGRLAKYELYELKFEVNR